MPKTKYVKAEDGPKKFLRTRPNQDSSDNLKEMG